MFILHKKYSKKLDEELNKKFKSTIKFSNNDINEFILLLRKDVYLTNIWMIGKILMKQNNLEKEDFYSNLNMEETKDSDYMHGKRVCKDFEVKNLGKYHDLYLESDTLLLADVFGNFRQMCLKIYQLDPEKFLLIPGLALQAALKKTEVKLELLTDIDILLMVE